MRDRLTFYRPQGDYRARIGWRGDALRLVAQGGGPADSSPLLFVVGDRSFEVVVEVEVEGGAQGGLLLFYNDRLFCGAGLDGKRLHAWKLDAEERYPPGAALAARRQRLRLRNVENVVTFAHSPDGARWTKERSFEVLGYNHNMGEEFLSLRPALYAAGTGHVTFRRLARRALVGRPAE